MPDSVKNRPVIVIAETKTSHALDLATLAVVGASVAVLSSSWNSLPELVVSHFDAYGHVNGTLPKLFLWGLVGFNVLIVALFSVVSRFQHYFNYAVKITAENALRQYTLINFFMHVLGLELSIIFLFIVHTCVDATFNPGQTLNTPLLLTLVIMQMGTVIWYLQRSFKMR